MAILDDALHAIVADLDADLTAAGLSRKRGGLAGGVHWAEASGRHADGSWLELRVRHDPIDTTLEAALLAYRPLSRGGRTAVLGEATHEYRQGTDEVRAALVAEVRVWLAFLCVPTEAR